VETSVSVEATELCRLRERVGDTAKSGKEGVEGVVGVFMGDLCSCILPVVQFSKVVVLLETLFVMLGFLSAADINVSSILQIL
jgi:hypothetical protein